MHIPGLQPKKSESLKMEIGISNKFLSDSKNH